MKWSIITNRDELYDRSTSVIKALNLHQSKFSFHQALSQLFSEFSLYIIQLRDYRLIHHPSSICNSLGGDASLQKTINCIHSACASACACAFMSNPRVATPYIILLRFSNSHSIYCRLFNDCGTQFKYFKYNYLIPAVASNLIYYDHESHRFDRYQKSNKLVRFGTFDDNISCLTSSYLVFLVSPSLSGASTETWPNSFTRLWSTR